MIYYRIKTIYVCLILFSAYPGIASGSNLNKCVNSDGKVEYRDQPCPSMSNSSVVTPVRSLDRSKIQSQQIPSTSRTQGLPQPSPHVVSSQINSPKSQTQVNDTGKDKSGSVKFTQPDTTDPRMALFVRWHKSLIENDYATFKSLDVSGLAGREVPRSHLEDLRKNAPAIVKISEFKANSNNTIAQFFAVGCKDGEPFASEVVVTKYINFWKVGGSQGWTRYWEEVSLADFPCGKEVHTLERKNTPKADFKNREVKLVNGLTAEDRMKSCDPNMALAAAEETVSNPAYLEEPIQLFLPAFIFFQNGRKDDGVFWLYAAQLRTKQQMVTAKGDRGQIMSIMMMTMGPFINNYAFQNTSNLNRILDKVLKWDKDTPNPLLEEARAQKLDKQIEPIYTGFAELKTKIVTDKSSLEAAARQEAPSIEQMYAQMNSQRCRKGQPDPAYDNKTKKEEAQLAMDYIISNEQVIKLVGGTVKTSPSLSTTYSWDKNKGRYEFSINAPQKSQAILDVDRSSGKPIFSLACVTTLPMGARQAGKDACSQSTVPLPK